MQAIECDGLVEGPGKPTFGAGAVVTENVDAQSIVHLTHCFDGIDQAAYLVVGVFREGSEYLHL